MVILVILLNICILAASWVFEFHNFAIKGLYGFNIIVTVIILLFFIEFIYYIPLLFVVTYLSEQVVK